MRADAAVVGLRKMRIETGEMTIDAEPGSVRYWRASEGEAAECEITGVSAAHVAALVVAAATPGYSAEATLGVLSYLHRNEHFDSAGRLVSPPPGWDRDDVIAKSAVDRRGRVRV